ncbi:response regulator [Elusimicrobiota bacterium]
MAKRALIIDDQAEIRRVFARILSFEGWESDVCAGPTEALTTFRKGRYDCVFSDINLRSAVDGIMIALELQRQEPGLPVVLMSSREQRARVQSAGIELFLEKPFAVPKILAILQKLERTATSKGTVLVIDDDEEYVTMTADLLKEVGYRVVTACNGEEGLRKADAERPDLAIVDIMMPVVHGFDVCQRLRANGHRRGLGILVVSARHFETDVRVAHQMGADRYLKKPYEIDHFLLAVAQLSGRPAQSSLPGQAA